MQAQLPIEALLRVVARPYQMSHPTVLTGFICEMNMNLETEQLKLRLIETQMLLLQYQHKEVLANIAAASEPEKVAL